MKVKLDYDNMHLYAIGAPVEGELLVLNYIRSSVVQEKKIVASIDVERIWGNKL